MDIRKKLLSLVGVLALTMSMSTGFVAAQTEPAPVGDTIGVTFTVACEPGVSSATIGRSDLGEGQVAFPNFDPANPGDGSVSTDPGVFRVTVNLDCPDAGWTVTAAINDFKTADESQSFSGSKFQLTHSNTAWTDGTNDVTGVSVPGPTVLFTSSGNVEPYTSAVLAQETTGTSATAFYMDFTGQLVGLNDGTVDAGDYSTQITVTFNAGGL